tara:strand:- start:96 stop:305 length:210 start_codon:yes stop_codon:yes gene_type:complete
MDDADNNDDYAKMFYANISDYLRNVHRLEVRDVSSRGAEEYRMLVDFEDQVISIHFTRAKDAEQAGHGD